MLRFVATRGGLPLRMSWPHKYTRVIITVGAILVLQAVAAGLARRLTCGYTSLPLPVKIWRAPNASANHGSCAAALAAQPLPLAGPGGVNGDYTFASAHLLWEHLRPCTMTLLRQGVYVYKPTDLNNLDLLPLSGDLVGPWATKFDQYSADAYLVHLLSTSDIVTHDPESAALFIVPFYGTHEAHYCAFNLHNPNVGKDLVSCAEWIERNYTRPWRDALRQSPWFQRHNGADHIFVAPWDWGVYLFKRNDDAFFNWLQHETDLQVAQYLPLPELRGLERTVVMPVPQPNPVAPMTVLHAALVPPPAGWTGSDTTYRLATPGTGGCDLSNVKWLATFRGTVWPDRGYSGGIRQDLLARYSSAVNSTGAAADGVLFEAGHTTPEQYSAELHDTRFCLSPPGSSAWSQRIYDLVAAGCAMVFFDSAVKGPPALAFSEFISWEDLSVTIPAGRHMDVATILRAIPDKRVCAMRRAAVTAASFLLWNRDPQSVATLVAASALARAQRLIAGNAMH